MRINQEKRLYPRVEYKLPIKVAADGYDFITTTKNVSCVGVYCRIEKYIPPFTRVLVKMNPPILVECKGVVVRTEDEEKGNGFNIAIFFNEISEGQRKKIGRYISQFLPQSLPS
jgi:c-di-GMP-binding flagellar brake protein YcgR